VLDNDPGAARGSLYQAKAIAEELGVGEHSELARAIAELEEALSDGEPDGDIGGGAGPGGESVRSEESQLVLVEAERLRELGNIEYEQSNFDEAKRCYEGALDLFRTHGDRSGEGIVLGKLGSICRTWSQHERAIDLYTQALDIHREVGDKKNEGFNLGNLGNVFFVQGQFERAKTHYKAALAIHREDGSRIQEGITLGNLVFAKGQYEDAIAFYTAALDILREIGAKRDEGIFLGNLGNVYRMQGQQERALELYTAALDISKETGDKRHEGMSLGNLGGVLFLLGRVDEAEVAFKRAILLSDEALPAAGGAFRGDLALLLAHQDQHEDAHALIEAGEPQVTSDPEEHAKFLCKKGQIELLAGQAEDAEASLQRAREIAEQLGLTAGSPLGAEIATLSECLFAGTPTWLGED
jgi:tetratricopeptide (TPR) repeat protein